MPMFAKSLLKSSARIAQASRQHYFHTTAFRAFPKATEHQSSPESLNSLATRLKLKFHQKDILSQALTHKSFRHGTVATNENLIQYGNRVLGYYVATSLPTDASEETMKNALRGYNDPKFLASVADELKIEDCLQYQLPPDTAPTGISSIKAGSLKALLGAIYHDQGETVAREFVNKHILSRKLVV
ncbi:ribonuclease III domain-containing protein [Umbelopsis sp. PMI_123]|nr:ribonuclease III domain-containing protein [Umbelopsis sp. PMI_123]